MDFISYVIIGIYAVDILLLFFFGLHSYLMVYLYRRNEKYCVTGQEPVHQPIDLAQAKAADLPEVTIQLPVFNEFYVVDRLIEATVAVQWPREKLEIQVLDDSTDETYEKIAGLVEYYRSLGHDIHHVHRTNRHGHKAGALREGLEVAKGEFVAVFDADFMPATDFLVKTVPYFDQNDIGMVQTRWGHINDDFSLLTRAQSMGIDGHFMIEQVARNCNNLWMNFNGTGGIWRKTCIIDAGNWQSDTLTEDFDLSYRAELAGWKFRYFKDVVNPAELPATISAFKSQQFRWCKGSIQTAVKLIPRILRSKFNARIKAEAVVHLLNYSVHPLMIINILFALPLLMMDYWAGYSLYDLSLAVLFVAAAFLSLGTFGPSVFYLYSQKELYPDWKFKMIWLPALMMIGTGIAVSQTRAWIEGLIGVQSSFKRTPKYRIESKQDDLLARMKYKMPFDWFILLEIFMGLYCLVCIGASFLNNRLFVAPFMVLYAGGFFYIAFKGLRESTLRPRAALKVATAESR